jgi:hypothetical protein
VMKKNAALIKYPTPIVLSIKKDSIPIRNRGVFSVDDYIFFCILIIYVNILYYSISIAINGKCIDSDSWSFSREVS